MRSLSLRQFAALFALLLAGRVLCAQGLMPLVPGQNQPANPLQNLPTRTVHLQAVLVSALDGKPVSRALVSSIDGRFAALTDWQGRISFDYRLPDSDAASRQFPGLMQSAQLLRFSVKKPGYVSQTTSVTLPSFDPSGPAPLLQLKIAPCGVLSGHVSVDSGERPQALYVQLLRKQVQNGLGTWMVAGATPVSADGEFRFSDLAPGDYQVMTGAWTPPSGMRQQQPDVVRGLLPSYFPEPSGGAEAPTLHVGAGEIATANLTLHWANFYHVALPVSGRRPGRNFGVVLVPNQMGYNVRMNPATGTVEGYLPSGSYAVRITSFENGPPGAQRATPGRMQQSGGIAHFQVGSGPVFSPPVTASPGADIQVNITRELVNQQNGNSQGQIAAQGPPVFLNLQPVDNEGMPVSNPPNPAGPSDNYVLHDVSEGVYHVNLTAGQGYIASAMSGSTDLLRDPLTVGSGTSAPSIDITVRDDPASVLGRVITGQPGSAQQESADPVFVLCIPLDRPQVPAVMGVWNAQWGFRSPPLAPGRYLLLASRDQIFQTIEYRNPDVLRTIMSKGTVITLSGGQKAEVDIPLMPEGAS